MVKMTLRATAKLSATSMEWPPATLKAARPPSHKATEVISAPTSPAMVSTGAAGRMRSSLRSNSSSISKMPVPATNNKGHRTE